MVVYKQRAERFEIEGYPLWLSSLLHARGISTRQEAEAFLAPSLRQLHEPAQLCGMEKAVELIRDAAQRRRRVVVYGDYDVDGMCASAILYETLKSMGVRTMVYIPDRHSEGYGLNLDAVEKLSAQADMLISVDCGITSVREVQAARERGMTVIITDHHTLPETLPPADAVLSPLVGAYPFPYLCGAGVAWKLSWALKGLAFAEKQLDLAGLATMADMVPLHGENRVLAALGIRAMSFTARPGLRKLKEVARIAEGGVLSGDQMVFQLAPRLNAGGRLSTAMDALELLKADSEQKAEGLAQKLDALNTLRRQEEQAVLEQAEAQIQGDALFCRRSLVVAGESWNSGVIGLAAGRLAERYGYPAVALAANRENYVGSGRSAGGINLYQALKACEDLFVRFGGHPKAAGLTMPRENLQAFIRRFDEAVRAQLGEGDLIPEQQYDAALPFEEVTPRLVRQLDALAPFGIGNPAPVFLAQGVRAVRQDAVGQERRHLKLTLQDEGAVRNGIAFSMGHLSGKLKGEVDVLFEPRINDFRGQESAECLVKSIKPGAGFFTADAALEKGIVLQELTQPASNNNNVGFTLLSEPPKLSAARGTLLLCRTWETADALRRMYPEADAVEGEASDAHAFNTVALNMLTANIRAPFDTVVFADGVMSGEEVKRARALLPRAEIQGCPLSKSLRRLLRAIAPSKEELREAYKALRRGGTLPWDADKNEAALCILAELALIRRSGHAVEMLPLRKCDPAESPLFTALSAG